MVASYYITLVLDPKLQKATKEEGRNYRIVDLLFNVARCQKSPEVGTLFEILTLSVNELRLVETRADEWRGQTKLEARDS